MDNVLVDFPSGIARTSKEKQMEYQGRLDEVPGIFALMDPLKGAIEAYKNCPQNTILTFSQLLLGRTQADGVIKMNG